MFLIRTSKQIKLQSCAKSQIVGNYFALLYLIVFSRVHATLYVTMSVRRSVRRSVRWSVCRSEITSLFLAFGAEGRSDLTYCPCPTTILPMPTRTRLMLPCIWPCFIWIFVAICLSHLFSCKKLLCKRLCPSFCWPISLLFPPSVRPSAGPSHVSQKLQIYENFRKIK